MARQFNKEVERAAFSRCRGRCEICTAKLAAGNINYDHIIPWALSRDSSLTNCQVLCNGCHRDKTISRDRPSIDKAKRVSDFHLGIAGPGLGRSPMPCGRRSDLIKTFRHGVQARLSQSAKHRRAMAKRGPWGQR
jgi:hypothetical protein